MAAHMEDGSLPLDALQAWPQASALEAERLLRAARGVPSADVQAPELLCSLGHLDDQRRVRGRLIIADVQRDSDQVRVVDNVRFTGRQSGSSQK